MEAGVPLATIQNWLGHANISQTSKYLATTTPGEHEAHATVRRADRPVDTD
jgi:site-specific recombinase XerD